MEKILVLVFDTHTIEDWLEFCMMTLQRFKPTTHILIPIDRHVIAHIASNEGVKEIEIRERLLHEAYLNLYHLEDIFSKRGSKVTIAAKEMTLPEELLGEIKKTNPEMLVVIGKIDTVVLESLYGLLRMPILLLPPGD